MRILADARQLLLVHIDAGPPFISWRAHQRMLAPFRPIFRHKYDIYGSHYARQVIIKYFVEIRATIFSDLALFLPHRTA